MTEVKTITRSVIEAIQNVAGKTKLSLHEPIFFGKEYEYLKNCLDTTYVSTIGKYVETFEKYLLIIQVLNLLLELLWNIWASNCSYVVWC